MCRNRSDQIDHIRQNLIVYLHRKGTEGDYIPIGTGFFISNDGTIMTAKHNIDFLTNCSYWALYHGAYYEIHQKENIHYQYSGVDIILVQIDIQLNLNNCDFLTYYTLSENLLLSEDIVVIGYENKSKRILCTSGTICGITNGRYEIQNANVGNGNSGAPVILKKDLRTLVGVMSKREGLLLDLKSYKIKSDKFGIGYAHSIGLFNKECTIDVLENNNICNLLNTRELNQWEAFFYSHINMICENYRKCPNPIYTFEKYFKKYKIESIPLDEFCEFLIRNKIYLYSTGKLYELIGNMLINSGMTIIMPAARAYLKSANIIYENLNYSIDEVIKRRIRVIWLISITYKLERNYGESVKICENSIRDFKGECSKFLIPYSSALILPEREIAVIEQQMGYFRALKSKSHLYESDMIETFFTNRRIFEFYLSQNNVNAAKRIYSDLMVSYHKTKHQLEPIYKFTLAKNLYLYNTLLRRKKAAKKYFDYASANFVHWRLKGQQNALLKLQDNLSI